MAPEVVRALGVGGWGAQKPPPRGQAQVQQEQPVLSPVAFGPQAQVLGFHVPMHIPAAQPNMCQLQRLLFCAWVPSPDMGCVWSGAKVLTVLGRRGSAGAGTVVPAGALGLGLQSGFDGPAWLTVRLPAVRNSSRTTKSPTQLGMSVETSQHGATGPTQEGQSCGWHSCPKQRASRQ